MSRTIKKPLAQLSSDLHVFGTQINNEVIELKRNAEVKPVTGATLYRHCLEDLNDRLTSLSEDVEALESVSLDAISLEELVGHCVSLYQRNAAAIAVLESRLQSFGYTQSCEPLPPQNPLELTDQLIAAAAQENSNNFLDSPATHEQNRDSFSSLSPEAMMLPPATINRYQPTTTATATVQKALAPMTAAKARLISKDDTPSSLDSPDALTPSMRHLLGKYASASSSDGLSPAKTTINTLGTAPSPLRGLSPIPLSPAFAAAAEQQRAQIEAAPEPIADASPIELPGSSPVAVPSDTPMESDLQAVDAYIASTAQKLAEYPGLLDSYREKYPHVVASTERLMLASAGGAGRSAPSLQYPTPLSTGGAAAAATAAADQQQYFDEESTMQLKDQVIYNRARAFQQAYEAQCKTGAGLASLLSPTLPVGVVGVDGPDRASSVSFLPPPSQEQDLTAQRNRESLEEAIAEALSRPSISSASGTITSADEGVAKHHITPAASALSSGTANINTAATAKTTATVHSTRSSVPPTLTPSLPTTVPPFHDIEESEYYSILPSFIQSKVSLDVLNTIAKELHAMVSRRCANGDGTSFTIDEVESVGSFAAGRGKVLINALSKLGRVQVKVVYGQGTVYFFTSRD